ncbi:hypothetical protein KVR01_000360 [Diaporthe batatas]|uniref:uncharacterized protein n=1 Tax=Diaporthe batatas TaxID=748121 RepID=UPI001D0507B6|nr:uncharacterized protein KVR01_000360 [Diaporthe batatas]KAG8169615.1 hypothetical protein KVR01_000360 [Diaporthe batatas]
MPCVRAGGEPAVGGVRANRRRPKQKQSTHARGAWHGWHAALGSWWWRRGRWEKRAQAAARPAFDTLLVTCDNWPTTPPNLEISSEQLPPRPWS